MSGLASAGIASFLLAISHLAGGQPPDALDTLRAIPGWDSLSASGSFALPASPRHPIRIGVGDRTLEIVALDVREVPPAHREGITIFADAATETDLVWIPQRAGFEEWRIVRSRRAPHAMRHHLHTGAGIAAVRMRDDRIEALGDAGNVAIATAPLRAFDADGVSLRLDVRLTILGAHDFEVEVALDPAAVARAAYPIAIDPAWNFGFGFPVGRVDPCVAVVSDGRILVVGGDDGTGRGGRYDNIFNPLTGALVNGGVGYSGLQACARLTDGRFVRSGGFGGLNDTGVTDLFTPATGWSSLAQPKSTTTYSARTNGAALVQLDADRLLMLGGFSSNGTNDSTAEIYSFAANAWSFTGSLINPRRGAVAVKLTDGSVLVVGGDNTTSAERWAGGAFQYTTGKMAVARGEGSTVTLLTSGEVLVIGGSKVAELYSPVTRTFRATGSMSVSRLHHTATRLNDGRVLVAGGDGLASAEIYNPATGTFSPAGNMLTARSGAGAALMLDSRVVVAGGKNDKGFYENTAEYWGNPNGIACTSNNDCVSNHCTDGVCCSVASCGAGLSCGNPQKLGVCSKALGSACAANAECASGQCADGVCCSTACAGTCASCALPGKVGVCSPVVGAPAPGHGSCSGAGVGTECGPACDGTSLVACATPSASTVCGKKSCADGKATALGTCNGKGACVAAVTSCGNYACDTAGGVCRVACTKSSDCAPSFGCDGGLCVAPTDLGAPCKTGASCTTGFCSDGVCCNVSSCGVDASCALGKPAGTCGTKQGRVCAGDGECGTGHCVDGVCCDAACTGQCEACDVDGYVGTCSPAVGAPHGSRAPCSAGDSDVCQAKTCKGSDDRTQCTGFLNGPKVKCSPARCDNATAVADAFCDGAGSCGKPVASACLPYACDGTSCRTTCSDNTHCAPGNVCKAGRCESAAGTCSADGRSSVSAGGVVEDCTPFRCLEATGACAKSCETSAECAVGVCNAATGQCAADPPVEDGGGCSQSSGPASAAGVLCVVAMAFLAARRKRA